MLMDSGWLSFRTGRWTTAYAGLTEANRLARETGQPNIVAYSLVALARLAAAQGRESECRTQVVEALTIAEHFLEDAIQQWAGAALGFLALSIGATEEAIDELEAVARSSEQNEIREPAIIQWPADLIEAYVRADRLQDAEAALERFDEQAQRTRITWSLAATSRCRGLLAGDDQFEEEFTDALRWHERTPTPFERARTELCLGERRRRARQRTEARGPLRTALATFERLGATRWAERARTELRATGETVRRHDAQAAEQLTAPELQVALVVCGGASNQEAAAALFLSPKTIEFHLRNAYRKLNVRSRTGLAAVLAHEAPAYASVSPAKA
jgi:ATP/maltotriose-dependent transcriptional regulator MalT